MSAEDPTPLSLVVQSLQDFRKDMNQRFGSVDEQLAEIEAHVRATNGRVTGLEMREQRREGIKSAWGWVPKGIFVFLSAAGTIAATLLITGAH